MGNKCEELAARIEAFGREVIDYVSALSDEDWRKTCDWENWSVGTTARHIGNHFGISDLAAMMVRGEALPQWTMADINHRSNQDSHEHGDCTKGEALAHLRDKGDGMTAFLRGLDEADLDRKGSMPAFGGEVTVAGLIDFVIFQSAAQHLDSIRKAAGG
jgi:hypothetical protein